MADAQDVFDEFAVAVTPPRGDEDKAHVTDLAGCDRATGGRRNGEPMAPLDADLRRKFRLGFLIEADLLTALYGHRPDLQRGARVALWVGMGGRIEGKLVSDDYIPAPDEVVGHPDGVLDDALIECKSTEFLPDRNNGYARIVPLREDDLLWHHRIQASAYALALGLPRAIVVSECRVSGMLSIVEFDPLDYEAEICKRIRMVLAATSSAAEPSLHPSTFNKKGESWHCKHCLLTSCEYNRHSVRIVEGRHVVEV